MEVGAGEVLSRDESWELLTTVPVGRLVLSLRALPVILPVQYYVDGDELAVCLGHHTIPPESLNEAIVAFGADAIDLSTRSGWTVQVQGMSRVPRGPAIETDCGQPTSGQIVHLVPATIEGHRVRLCPFMSGVTNRG